MGYSNHTILGATIEPWMWRAARSIVSLFPSYEEGFCNKVEEVACEIANSAMIDRIPE